MIIAIYVLEYVIRNHFRIDCRTAVFPSLLRLRAHSAVLIHTFCEWGTLWLIHSSGASYDQGSPGARVVWLNQILKVDLQLPHAATVEFFGRVVVSATELNTLCFFIAPLPAHAQGIGDLDFRFGRRDERDASLER